MRGLWKPVAGGTGLITIVFVALTALEGQPLAPWLLVPALIGGAMMGLAYGVPAYLVVRRFLGGMQAAGADPRVVETEVGWLGDRTVRVETQAGTWTLEAEGGRRWYTLAVTPPDGQRLHVSRNKKEAGEEIATRVLVGEPAADPEAGPWGIDPDKLHEAGQQLGAHRWTLGLAVLLSGVGLHVASARALTSGAHTLPGFLLEGGLWIGLIVTGFTCLFLSMLALSASLGGQRIVTDQGPPRPTINGGLLTGLGAWTLGVAGPWALSAWLYAQLHPTLLVPIGLGLVALGFGFLAARRGGATHRILMTVGSLVGGAAALWLPVGELFGAITAMLALFALLLGFVGDVDPEDLEALEEHQAGS